MKKKKRAPRSNRMFLRKNIDIRERRSKLSLLRFLYPEEEDEFGFTLCPECAKLGYCLDSARRTEARELAAYEQEVSLYNYNNGKSFADFVPTVVSPAGRGAFSYDHMRKGCSAFHEDDFETAFLHFKTITAEVSSDAEAQLCVAVCLFFMKEYLEAVDAMSRCGYFGFEKTPSPEFFKAFERIAVCRANENPGSKEDHVDAVEQKIRQTQSVEFDDVTDSVETTSSKLSFSQTIV